MLSAPEELLAPPETLAPPEPDDPETEAEVVVMVELPLKLRAIVGR